MKLLLAVLLSFLCVRATAQLYDDATINGFIPKQAGKEIVITGPNHFKKTETADETGTFKFTFKTRSGYYLIRYGTNGYFVYVNPGAYFGISIKDTSLYFTGEHDRGAGQNTMIKRLVEITKQYFGRTDGELPAAMYQTEPAKFIETLDSYKTAALKLLNSQTFDDFFLRTQTDYIEYKTRYFAYNYELKYGIDPAKQKAAIELITQRPAGQSMTPELSGKVTEALIAARDKQLSMADRNTLEQRIWEDFDINNEGIYNYSGLYNKLVDVRLTQLLNAEYTTAPYLRSKGIYQNTYDIVKKEIINDHIKQSLLYRYVTAIIKAGKDADKYYNDYMGIATDPVYIADVKTSYNNNKLIAPGEPAPDFTFTDINNNKVTLSSLKGNYVYIDVWAQWCAPCKNEIPSLIQIEKKYDGQNIKFVSLSIDAAADVNKWVTYVLDNHLTGIQLIADNNWNSDWVKKFNINSIPRFILIDPDGKIISANADRPSNPALQTLLDKLLNKS